MVPVVAYLFVCLFVDVGGGDEHPELAVLDPANQARKLFDADRVAGLVTLGFEGEVEADRVRCWPDGVLPNGVTATVAAWAGHIDVLNPWRREAEQLDGAALEIDGPVFEVLPEHLKQDNIPGYGR